MITKQMEPTRQRAWLVAYLAEDEDGLVQGYRVKAVSPTAAGALRIVGAWIGSGKRYFITDIGIAAEETGGLGDGPQPDPFADPLDWPWEQEG